LGDHLGFALNARTDTVSLAVSSTQRVSGGPGTLILLEAQTQGEGTSALQLEEFQFGEGNPEASLTNGSITVGDANMDASVTFDDQTAEDRQTVTVASVSLPEDGYVAIHDSTLLDDPPQVTGSVVGMSEYLEAGDYTDLDVTLFDVSGADFPADTSLTGAPLLIAMPHQETSGNQETSSNQEYNFPTSGGNADGPYFDMNGNPVVSSSTASRSRRRRRTRSTARRCFPTTRRKTRTSRRRSTTASASRCVP